MPTPCLGSADPVDPKQITQIGCDAGPSRPRARFWAPSPAFSASSQQSRVDHHRLNRLLRRHSRAVLNLDGVVEFVAFVLDPSARAFILPSLPGVIGAANATLHAPDEDEPDAIHALGQLAPGTPAQRERWLAYHQNLPAPGVHALTIESVKAEGEVFDMDEITLANPLQGHHAALIRLLNADPGRLANLCERLTRVRPAAPIAVGIDPWGLDVRARVGVMRVEFDPPIDPANAETSLRERLNHP